MDKREKTELLLSFYGDDFTGSTDAMESLTLNGIPTALFLEPPTLGEVENFRLENNAYRNNRKLKAFGVAGVSRSLSPAQMSKELPGIFERISKVPAEFFHYKICSTFDSSPKVGNIGHAVELALKYFPSPCIPLLVGAPALNRFCIFGNLFARADGVTYRLDRHPTMAKHPVTPMDESDLRVHLGAQTSRKVHLVDIFSLQDSSTKAEDFIQEVSNRPTPEYILFDVLHEDHLVRTGELLYENRAEKNQLLVGSSGIENALTGYLQEKLEIVKPEEAAVPGKADTLIVMAGSCAPGTKSQINWAIQKGFAGIRLHTPDLVAPEGREAEAARVIQAAESWIRKGKSIVIYSALGPDDPAIKLTKEKLQEVGSEEGATYEEISLTEILPKCQGMILKTILEAHPGARVVVAGGDTSGHVARALGIYALEVLVPIAPGSPLCLAHSRNPLFHGMQIALKGGQVGNEKYLESILYGKPMS